MAGLVFFGREEDGGSEGRGDGMLVPLPLLCDMLRVRERRARRVRGGEASLSRTRCEQAVGTIGGHVAFLVTIPRSFAFVVVGGCIRHGVLNPGPRPVFGLVCDLARCGTHVRFVIRKAVVRLQVCLLETAKARALTYAFSVYLCANNAK